MLEKLAELIKEQLNYDGEVKAESNFKDDLGADSLDLFELVMSMEEEIGFINMTFTPNGLLVRSFTLRICSRTTSGGALAAPIIPSPPASDTAAAR